MRDIVPLKALQLHSFFLESGALVGFFFLPKRIYLGVMKKQIHFVKKHSHSKKETFYTSA